MTGDFCQKGCPDVPVLQLKKGGDWHRQEISTDDLFSSGSNNWDRFIYPESKLSIILAKANKIRKCSACRRSFIDSFCMTELWWSDYYKRSNGYFGCENTRQGVPGFNTWAFFEVKQLGDAKQYQWYKINVFTRWLPQTKQTVVILFEDQSSLLENVGNMPSQLLEPELDSERLDDPFWIYTRLAAEVVRLEDSAIWAVRNKVREIETERKPLGRPQPEYRRLHDISRHAIHVSETLDVAMQTMQGIVLEHKEFMTTVSNDGKEASQDIHRWLRSFEQMIGNLRHRSIANEKRLLSEIELAFNTVAQHDAMTTVQIGRDTRSDSAAMKTISIVTLTFLPPTFISAIFGMSFFDYSGESDWTVSSQIWIYWAVAIPTTVITYLSWLYWHKLSAAAEKSGRIP